MCMCACVRASVCFNKQQNCSESPPFAWPICFNSMAYENGG